MNQMNTNIPMEDPTGKRCFVNSWDVNARKADGWKVIGDLAIHTSKTASPTDLLNGGSPATAAPAPAAPAPAAGADMVAAERARVRGIMKAADDGQEDLADRLIAEGKSEAEAVQALAADRAARRSKKATAPVVSSDAPAPAPTTK